MCTRRSRDRRDTSKPFPTLADEEYQNHPGLGLMQILYLYIFCTFLSYRVSLSWKSFSRFLSCQLRLRFQSLQSPRLSLDFFWHGSWEMIDGEMASVLCVNYIYVFIFLGVEEIFTYFKISFCSAKKWLRSKTLKKKICGKTFFFNQPHSQSSIFFYKFRYWNSLT